MPKIVLEHVTKRWGDFYGAKDLNFTIEDREFITLLGPSGCGKTTTLRMIAGLETPTSGRITIGNKVVFDSENGINLSPARRDIGFLFQNYALWPHMTVYKNIHFGLENLKISKEVVDAQGNVVMGPDKDKIEGLKGLIKEEKDPEKLEDLKRRLEEAKVEKIVPVTKERHLTKAEMEELPENVKKQIAEMTDVFMTPMGTPVPAKTAPAVKKPVPSKEIPAGSEKSLDLKKKTDANGSRRR